SSTRCRLARREKVRHADREFSTPDLREGPCGFLFVALRAAPLNLRSSSHLQSGVSFGNTWREAFAVPIARPMFRPDSINLSHVQRILRIEASQMTKAVRQ